MCSDAFQDKLSLTPLHCPIFCAFNGLYSGLKSSHSPQHMPSIRQTLLDGNFAFMTQTDSFVGLFMLSLLLLLAALALYESDLHGRLNPSDSPKPFLSPKNDVPAWAL